MISDEYVAGLLDGEGHIKIEHRPRRDRGRRDEWVSSIYVAFTMVDRAPLDAIAERFGGRVYTLTSASPRWKVPYRWQSTGPSAETLLRAARPYLLVKHRQADLALEFRATLMQGGRTTPIRERLNAETLVRRLTLRDEVRALNQRGVA